MMEEKRSNRPNNERRHTQWEGLFVSQHAWDSDDISDSQPMLSAEEKQAIWNMLLVALNRQCTIFIQSWEDHHFKFHRCIIRKIDRAQRIVSYVDKLGERQLAVDTITSTHILD